MSKKIRIALIGVGYRGAYLLKLLGAMSELVELVGIADPKLQSTAYTGIRIYNEGLYAYTRMIEEQSPDLVIIASPWQYHIEQAVYALERGCHIALEIKPGLNLATEESEYTPLLPLLQSKGLKCYPLENALFKREMLALFRLVREGLLGDLVHLRGGYRHDLRSVLLDEEGKPRTEGEGAWRYHYYEQCNADIYPTHGFAPLAMLIDLGKSDTLYSLYSQSSLNQGLKVRLHHSLKEPHLSDVITTHIKTKRGVLINLIHDTSLPRPRSLDWEIQGTRGIWDGDKRRIYIEGRSPKEEWEDDTHYLIEYEHPYWQTWGEEALIVDEHHQGMDYIMLRAVLADLLGEYPYPANINDLILWCSITPLSAQSIAHGKALLF